MKRITLLSVLCLAVFGGANAADMTGDFNTWLGYIAGINSDGERSTVQGAGAGGEATGLIRTDLIGAAAGAYSSHLTDCVGIGYRALRGASDMSEVVAIGTGEPQHARHQRAHLLRGRGAKSQCRRDTVQRRNGFNWRHGRKHLRAVACRVRPVC